MLDTRGSLGLFTRVSKSILKIAIVSADAEVRCACARMLAYGAGREWELEEKQPGEERGDPDLTIWDYVPGLELPAHVALEPATHLFLVDRKDLGVFRATSGDAQVGILLKPVTLAALSAFVEQRAARSSPEESRIGLLRADRDEMLQSLITACLKLQEYDQDRTRFLTRAVHDFRAPLTAVSGYCGLLLSEQAGALTADQKEIIRRMHQSARRLARLSTSMFQLGVARHFEATPVLRPGDLRSAIDQALHELGHMLDEKELGLSIDLLPCPEVLLFDRMQLEQLFVNLLDNGFRFTPRYGAVEIKGYPYFWERRGRQSGAPLGSSGGERRKANTRAANAYRIDIRDSGPGIPPELLERIFEEYTSYSGGNDRSGGGLGLAICKMIANRHQGRLWAENSGVGAVFSLVLPLGEDTGSASGGGSMVEISKERSTSGTGA